MKNSLQPLNGRNRRTVPVAARLFKVLLVLSATLSAPLLSFGQTFTGTGNWSDPSRWTPAAVPSGTANVIIDGVCTLDGSRAVAGITINAGRELIGGGGFLQIRDSWTNNGTFTPATSTVTFNNSTSTAQINGLPTAFHSLTLGRLSSAHTVVVNTAVTAVDLSLLEGTVEINPVGGSLVAGVLTVNSIPGQSAGVRGELTVSGSASIPAGSTLGLMGATTNLRIGGNFAVDGAFTSDSPAASVTFFSGTAGVISGSNLNLPATVRVSKTGGALTSFAAGTAASIGGALLIDSHLEVNRTLVVAGNTTVNGILDAKAQSITFNRDFTIAANGTFSTLAIPSNVFLQGNWVSNGAGATFNSANSTLILTGGDNSMISPGVLTRFNGITIQKTGLAAVSFQGFPLILQSDLNILSGALLCNNTTDVSTAFTPSAVCVGEDISIPNPDLSVGGDVSIGNMAALRLDDDNNDNNPNNISLWVNGALTDNNIEEPAYGTVTTQARGLLIGTQNVALRISNLNRPYIVFTGGDMVVKGLVPQLRDSEGTRSQGLGISLPNIIIYKSDNNRTFTIHSGANAAVPGDKHKLRVLGNLTIARGTLFTNATALLFGDSRNDEINVFGKLDVSPGSTLKMTTGGAAPAGTLSSGSILRGRRGGVVRFVGTPLEPVTVTREGQPGNYFGIAIYAGCSVYAYNTNFSFLTASNEDYNTISPEQNILNINRAGNGCTLPGTGGYESNGGLKIYQGAAINPDNQEDLLSPAAPFAGTEFNFSFCTFGGSANGMTHLTINTGQTLTIRNVLFTLPNGNPNMGGQKFSNIVANNPSTDNLSTTPTAATPVGSPPQITVLSSTGNAAGLNAEYFDGGDFELGYPNPADATVPNGSKGRIVWESLPFFFWVGGYDEIAFNRPTVAKYRTGESQTDWTNWKNWSLASNDPFSDGLIAYSNPDRIFPGQRTIAQATCDVADRPTSLPAGTPDNLYPLENYDVFLCRSALTDPVLNVAEITLKGSLVINSGVTINPFGNNAVYVQDDNTNFPLLKVNRFDINPHAASVVNNFRVLSTGNNILNVEGDLVAEVNGVLDATGNGTIRVGGNMFMLANLPYNNSIPPGNASSARNANQLNANTTFQYLYRSGQPTLIMNGIGLQEMRVRRNVLHNLTIDKPYNEIQVQGLSNTNETARFTVNNNLTIRSGNMKMLSNTPVLVNGDFILEGGSFNYNQKTYLTVRGNWQNTGGSVNTGSEGARINLHPWNATARVVLSAGQPFPQANFGHQDDASQFGLNYEIDRTPELYPSTGAFVNGIFGVNSNIVPYLQKSGGTVTGMTATNPDAPNLPKALVAVNVTYTIQDNFTSNSLTTIYPNRTFTTVEATKTIVKTVGMTIENRGLVDLKGGSELLLETSAATAPGTNTLLVKEGATLNAIGTPTADVKISRQNTTGSYAFRVEGTVSARYYHFEFMNQNGVDMRAVTTQAASPGLLFPALPFDATTNPDAGCFSDGLLTNGAAGGTLLYFGENTVPTNTVIYNANFPLNPGPSSHNVRQMPFPGVTATAGRVIYFRDATGTFAGENFDGDAHDAQAYTETPPVPPPAALKTFYGNIRWIDRIKRWTGAALADTRWSNPLNWTDEIVPTPDDDIVLDFSSPATNKGADFTYGYVVTIDGVPAVCRNLTVMGVDANGIATTTNQKVFIILANSINHPDSDLNITGDYSADKSADLRMTNGVFNNIRVGRSWSNEGRFRGQSSHTLPASPLDQDEADLLSLASRGVPFNNTATNRTGGTVEFTGNVGKRVVQTGSKATGIFDPFWNVEFLAGTTEINDVLRVDNDLIIRQGAVLDASIGNNPVFLRGDWLNDGGTFVPRQGRVTIAGFKSDPSGTALPTYITKNRTTGVVGGVENFFDLALYKQHEPTSMTSVLIGGNPNNVILNNRVTVANGLIFYRGRFVSVTDKEMILLENANFVRTPQDGTGNAFSLPILTSLQMLSTPPPPGNASTQVAQYSGYVNGPVGRFYSSSTSDVAGKFPISKDGEYIAHPTDGVKLTVRLTTNVPTVFSVEQFNANPDFPTTSPARIIPEPLNYISQSRYWVVKNIAASAVPFPGTNVANLSEGSISLPYRGAQESVPYVHGFNYTNLEQAMAKLLQISIVQDSASYARPFAASVLRGTAPKGTHWNNLGGVVSPTTSSTTIDTEEKFTTLGNGVFTFGFNYTILPAEILSLTARPRNNQIDVVWVTGSEENVSEFLVQRSANGRDFQTIGSVAGRRASSTQSYQFTDQQPLSGTNYYRLEQVDIHQQSTHSKTVTASLDGTSSASKGDITVYPNPIEGHQAQINILVPEEVRGTVKVSILDMKGQNVYSQRHQADSGQVVRISPGQQLPTGIYIVHVTSAEGVFQKKLIVR